MQAPLLGVGGWLGPDAVLEIKHRPGGAEHFAAPGASQHQELDGICRRRL